MVKKKENIDVEENNEIKFKLKDHKSDIDKYIKEKIEDESKKNLNIKDIKEQIDKYVKERVEVESASQSVKLLKKQLHSKKISSGIKTFIILCLLCCMGYGVYYLYNDGYFEENKGVKCSCKEKSTGNEVTPVKDKEKTELSLDELKVKYGYLMDSVIFDANSNYTRDFYAGKLTNEIKLYLSYKLINEEEIIASDDSIYFDATSLEASYKKIFDDEIKLASFKYNNASYAYLPVKEIYISNILPNEDKNITREIVDIFIDTDENVVITTVEGYISESNKLYNIVTNKEVHSYKANDSIIKYKDKLNTVKYVFSDGYLKNITK